MSKTNTGASKESVKSESFYQKVKGKEDFIILDVRSKEVSEQWSLDFDGIETINCPSFKLVEDIPADLEDKLGVDREIIVVCAKGKSSKMVADNLRSEGYNARSLEDGLNGWSRIYKRRQVPTDSDDVSVYQYERPSSGCLGYMLVSNDQAVVIDPLKQYSDRYVRDAEKLEVSIEYVVDTHIHADHISGFNSLFERTGATRIMYKDSKNRGVEYNFETVDDGDKINFGSEYLEVINTPGHTTDMTSYYIDNILFTGDSLFLDSIARPDLEDEDEAFDMAEDLYHTVNDMFKYPSDTIVAPGHKSEIHPSESLNRTFTDTLQVVRDNLDILNYKQNDFVDYVMKDMPPRPANYERIIQINKGLEDTSESEEYELELGPNNCSAS